MVKNEKLWIADQGDGTYRNPILYTDYSDPDVIRVGEDYFMVASSFCNTPALPVLHSKDLVNWKVISYGMETIPYPDYETPQHGRGVWAPAIRYHEEKFMIFFPMPDEGIFMVSTTDPFVGWSKPICVRKVVGWIDPCPFWDDDGKAYLVTAFARSRIGFKSILHLSSMKPDGTDVLDDGIHVYDGAKTQPTIEGPKLYKRNGYYYIFAPAGGVKTGWQTVLRSQHIWGPYEERIVMQQGNSETNGPHQGGWITTPNGEDWFIHFQDVGNSGRIVHLQPMSWIEDWPIIGIEGDVPGCGEPVTVYKKPEVKGEFKIEAPEDSDWFEGKKLALQWQWNANYKNEWYSLDKVEKALCLRAQHTNAALCDVSNLLLQKWPAPTFAITTELQLANLTEGDIAGMVSLGGVYSALAVKKEKGKFILLQFVGEWDKQNEVCTQVGSFEEHTLKIRMIVLPDGTVQYEIDTNKVDANKVDANEIDTNKVDAIDIKHQDKNQGVGIPVVMTPGRWVGVKAGLFCINKDKESTGYVTVDHFVFIDSEGPINEHSLR